MGRNPGGHTLNKLTALTVSRASKPGRYGDGGNLYLEVAQSGSKSWVFRFMLNGKAREMGLGPVSDVSLADARELAAGYRAAVRRGVDPIQARLQQRQVELQRAVEHENAQRTWRWCCETYVATVKVPELTNPKHAAQWGTTLATYTFPALGDRPVNTLTRDDVHQVLAPIWLTINETASRVRSRMEAVWGWAKVKGFCTGDNPAGWTHGLEHLLAAPSKVQVERHHPSLPYDRIAEFMAALRPKGGTGARALEFMILTAQRTNAIITMKWPEVDWVKKVWVSPADNMKGDYPHRVPLSHQALNLLRQMEERRDGDYVFHVNGGQASNAMMNMVINKGMHTDQTPWVDPKQDNARITPHGFRSTCRDWAAELTTYPFDVCEMVLAHSKGGKTVAAYLRADMLERRRPLMQEWADFCDGITARKP